MLEGVMFLVSCVAMALLAIWVMRNDKAGPTDRIDGWFAMRSRHLNEQPPTPEESRKNRSRHRSRERDRL